MWEEVLKDLQERDISERKRSEYITLYYSFMEYVDANPDINFAHAAEYIYWLIKTSSKSRVKICNDMLIISKAFGEISRRVGKGILCVVRYNLEVDEYKIDRALKNINSLRTRGAISIMLDTGLGREKTIYAKFSDYDEENGILYGKYQLSGRSMDIIRKIKEESVEPLQDHHLILNANYISKTEKRLVRSAVHTHYLLRWIRRLNIVSGINFHRLLAHRKSRCVYPYNALVRYCQYPVSTRKRK